MNLRAALRHSPLYAPYTRAKYRLSSKAREDLFTGFYRDNIWGDPDSASGSGSNLAETEQVRQHLPGLLRDLGAHSLLDVPCGDFAWMQHVDLDGIDYVGGDIVGQMVEELQQRYGRAGRRFVRLDLTIDELPACDAIMVRDLFLHLPEALGLKAIGNIRRSGATWLLASNYTTATDNPDIRMGDHRFLNMTLPPFGWSVPLRTIHEHSLERADKELGVWRIADLPS